MTDRAVRHEIVVGVDGSSSSDHAVRWAAREARMRNVELRLVHIITAPPWGPSSLSGGPLPPLADSSDWQRAEGTKIVCAAAKIANDSAHDGKRLQLHAEVYFAGIVPTLVDVAKDAHMLVVGCRGQAMMSRALLGSVSSGVLHHAHCPVAVIHDELHTDAMEYSKRPIVVGIDGSPASEAATAIAFDEASRRGVRLVALHAWSDGDVEKIPSLEESAQQRVAEETLAERLAGWRERYPDVTVSRIVLYNSPSRHLLEQAESAQLIVVGSHGRGGFSGMLLGSVSTTIAHAVGVPVIIARQR